MQDSKKDLLIYFIVVFISLFIAGLEVYFNINP